MEQKLTRFLQYLEVERGYSPNTIEAYRLDLTKGFFTFLRELGKLDLGQVTRDDIREYMEMLSKRGNSSITRRRKLASLKSFFNYLTENEGLEVDPTASVKSPKVPEKEPVYLTEEESIHLLKAIAQKSRPQVRERDMAMIILLLHTGARASELINLKLTDVDLQQGQIKIIRKGAKEQYLHLNGETIMALANYLNSRPQAQNGRFFVATNGDNLSRTYIYVTVRRYLSLGGINKGKYGPHLLRHTFCTRLHQKGVSPLVIRDLAGHKNLNTTMRYIKIENKEQAEAIDKLEFGIV